MTKHEKIGEAGVPSHTPGSHELKAEHMAKTDGIVPPGSVPSPEAEKHQPHKDKKEAS